MSLFGINLASRALQAHQRAMEATGQNIANVDTPGYSRQVAVTRSVSGPGAAALDPSGNPIAPGGGVDVALVQRTHAAWLDRAAGSLQAQTGEGTIDDRAAAQVEQLLAEPGEGGLESTLGRFFSAFNDLANRPDDLAARQAVTRVGAEVGGRFQRLTQGAAALRRDLFDQARDNVTAINDLARQVAALTRQIGQAQAASAQPNELLDQRDQLIDQLTQRAGATASGRDGGQLVVSIGGITLVQGDQAAALDLAPGNSLAVMLRGSGTAVTPPGGELRAEQQWVNTTLPDYQARLEAARDGFAAAVNTLHQSGKDRSGTPGQAFFVADAAGNLSVNPAVAADAGKVVAGDGTAGNGRIARAIADLGSAPGSVLPAYRGLVAEVGAAAVDSRHRSEQTRASLDQIQALQASESGVNLDEELAQMVSLEHVYAASARLLSTYDEMLGTLIERTGG